MARSSFGAVVLMALLAGLPTCSRAEITRIAIQSAQPYGDFAAGKYVRLEGEALGVLSPAEPIPDLDKAPRNVRSHTPGKRAASSCNNRPSCQPPNASSNLIFRISCSNSVRLISGHLLAHDKTGQITCYKTGHNMYSQQEHIQSLRMKGGRAIIAGLFRSRLIRD